MVDKFETGKKLDVAIKRAEKIKSFYSHVLAYIGVNAMVLIIWWEDNYIAGIFWPRCLFITAGVAGLILLGHGAAVSGPGLLLRKGWEEQKIKELAEKDKHNNTINNL